MAWKEYCAEYLIKELLKRMDRCTGHRDITAILLKTALRTKHFIDLSIETICHKLPNLITLRKNPLENTEGREENAGKEHFLPFPQYFPSFESRICIFKSYLFCGRWVHFEQVITIFFIYTYFNTLKKKALGKHYEKKVKAISPFSTMFSMQS